MTVVQDRVDTPGVTDGAAALDRARAAQEPWEALGVAGRAALLDRLPGVLGRNLDRIAATIHEENGKPLPEAMLHEAVVAVRLARHLVGAAPEVLGDRPVRVGYLPHRRVRRQQRAYGVVLAIAPWNLPFLIPLSQVLPALLAGNAVVLKPAEQTPRTAALLGELLAEAGLPADVLQVVPGDGSVGRALLADRPDKVLFTGSVATGRSVMAACAAYPVPVSLELGGVDAMIVRADADLERTAAAATWGALVNGGQACCAVERLVVHEDVADALLVRIADKMRRVDPTRDLAPAIDDRQLATWQAHAADARARAAEGSVRVYGGGRELPGRRFEPMLVAGEGVREAPVWTEESFGPLLAAVRFRTDDEAVAIHDATGYGLTASVFTADVAAGERMARRLRAGVVSVNDVAANLYGYVEVPWGGIGQSGFGRSHGTDALLDASWTQAIDTPRGFAFGPKRPWWFPYDLPLARVAADVGRGFAADLPPVRAARVAWAGLGLVPFLSRFPRL